jgi:hypothetical protein
MNRMMTMRESCFSVRDHAAPGPKLVLWTRNEASACPGIAGGQGVGREEDHIHL